MAGATRPCRSRADCCARGRSRATSSRGCSSGAVSMVVRVARRPVRDRCGILAPGLGPVRVRHRAGAGAAPGWPRGAGGLGGAGAGLVQGACAEPPAAPAAGTACPHVNLRGRPLRTQWPDWRTPRRAGWHGSWHVRGPDRTSRGDPLPGRRGLRRPGHTVQRGVGHLLRGDAALARGRSLATRGPVPARRRWLGRKRDRGPCPGRADRRPRLCAAGTERLGAPRP